ncbi:NAD(P)H-dependent oxidoreductase [Aerococcaceae bacterium zg-ZJ1578]|uniref:NADPH-dependent FMN reductase n=1 Tax=Aerococcaceae TaxID=186827 RepID=UPI0013B7C42B|nr:MULTISPECIES: NADPH-dependent FMN reductase [unclassified Facklamia]MBK0347131.1 NAD(P)H-dependent oxidoreductase [Aerococcaceae bacterium zg-1578]MBR7927604.1 NAD(P)H-dependent oxidoreductase [Aerococcaceae bacterium zg-ZUI334]MBS4462156.1 NAD(P)H-dependent oxidoreductase [Aerococcaceae bacterium zg-B36]QQD65427.1 NAD(P)H-dependent oxidoreductase [Aerococcaceae bacterium zg-252]NEW64614.1 NADPH-dependent FMN reductase [Facklamia sp. 252]
MKLIGLVGTNSSKSTNRQLLQFMSKHFTDKVEIEVLEISHLPFFDKPQSMIVPDIVKELAAKIEEADGVIISTPEYDHAVPAALMNALAWLSYGIHPLLNKPIMITGASYGTLGSSRAQAHLHQILNSPEIKARVMTGSDYLLAHSLQAFDANGDMINEESKEKLSKALDDFRVFVKITQQLSNTYDLLAKEVENFDWEKL